MTSTLTIEPQRVEKKVVAVVASNSWDYTLQTLTGNAPHRQQQNCSEKVRTLTCVWSWHLSTFFDGEITQMTIPWEMRDIGFMSSTHLSQPTLRMMHDMYMFLDVFGRVSHSWPSLLLEPYCCALAHLHLCNWVRPAPALKQGTNELSLPSISRSGCHIWEMDPFGSGLSVNLMDQATTASRPQRHVRETCSGFNWSETHMHYYILHQSTKIELSALQVKFHNSLSSWSKAENPETWAFSKLLLLCDRTLWSSCQPRWQIVTTLKYQI